MWEDRRSWGCCPPPFHSHIHSNAHPTPWCLPPLASGLVDGADDGPGWALELWPAEPLRSGEGEAMSFSPQDLADVVTQTLKTQTGEHS